MSNQIPGKLVSCTKMIYLEQVQMYNHKSVVAHPPLGLVFGITLEGDFLET